MAGVMCQCGEKVFIADDDPAAPMLKTPSVKVTCPRCGAQMECADAWVRYEAWEAERAKGMPVTSLPTFQYSMRPYGGSAQRAMEHSPILRPYMPPDDDDQPIVLIRRGGRTIKRGGF